MVSPVPTTVIPGSTSLPQPAPQQHQYGTRIRSNSVIRPSARLRHSPAPPPPPRRIKPVPIPKSKSTSVAPESPQSAYPPFPPENVMLHADDATSKVFLAIGRSFMSVDNRAMTIKDLAEMTTKFGLMCQNVSAAGQAITTYIRNHLQRCETQQDHPLLLRHVLSGTPSDDELVPALHSRVGGAHCVSNGPDRTTNFRRGTMVWYLSRAAGAPCPFARAGIRLCEYGENGKVGTIQNTGRERKRERDRLRRAEQCGQKRKRLLRACATRGAESDTSSEEEKRPPKVKLTLRLKPSSASPSSSTPTPASSLCSSNSAPSPEIIDLSRDSDSDSDDDSMSVDSSESEEEQSEGSWSMSPYPTHHISMSPYTPAVETYLGASKSMSTSPHRLPVDARRSPSVPYSAASSSPPPDSEDDDDYHISMAGSNRSYTRRAHSSSDEDDMDWDGSFLEDMEGDTETQWESPGPRSPSVQFEDAEVVVKREPNDVRDLLNAWDDMEAGMQVIAMVEQAAAGLAKDAGVQLKTEESDSWIWDGFANASVDNFSSPSEGSANVKQEEFDSTLPPYVNEAPVSYSSDSPISPTPFSPASTCGSPLETSLINGEARRNSGLIWMDVELLVPESVTPHDFDAGVWLQGSGSRSRSVVTPLDVPTPSSPVPPTSSTFPPRVRAPVLTLKLDPSSDCLDVTKAESHAGGSSALIPSLSSMSIHTPVSANVSSDLRSPVSKQPLSTETQSPASTMKPPNVHTCQPCFPPICATIVEGIPVYQVTLEETSVLRRIDTDFINISQIMKKYSHVTPSSTTMANAAVVDTGSDIVRGDWVPLAAAQTMAQELPQLSVFLSDTLHERFPPALHDFHRSSPRGRLINQFGPPFRASHQHLSSHRLDFPLEDPITSWERGTPSQWEVEDHLLYMHPTFTFAPLADTTTPLDTATVVETPLSPTEEEMFHTFCSGSDWETPVPPSTRGPVEQLPADTDQVPTGKETACLDRPLRRSKRVANAIASRSRTRSSKRGSRSSLS